MSSDAKRLNDPAVLPPSGYRRNHRHYELVSYVNCLVGCRISDNAEGTTLFEERIRQFIAANPATSDTARYYDAVQEYIGLDW